MRGAKRRLLTPDQERWVRKRYSTTTNAELVEQLESELGVSLTTRQITAWAKRNGLRKTAEVITKTRQGCAIHIYTDEEIGFIREFTPGHVYPEIADEFERRFGWKIRRSQYRNLCMRYGIRSGVRNYGCFEKGHIPANKGKTWDEYMSPENQRRIRESGNLYKPGNVPLNAYHEVLDMRTDPDGSRHIYVRPRNAKSSARMWISYAQFVWMQHHGRDFPDDCRCVHCDHDKSNNDPENLMAVPNDVYGIVTGNATGSAMEYWDRESLKLAMLHAKMIVARRRVEKVRPRRCVVCGTVFRPAEYQRDYADHVKTCQECNKQGRKRPRKKKEEKA